MRTERQASCQESAGGEMTVRGRILRPAASAWAAEISTASAMTSINRCSFDAGSSVEMDQVGRQVAGLFLPKGDEWIHARRTMRGKVERDPDARAKGGHDRPFTHHQSQDLLGASAECHS